MNQSASPDPRELPARAARGLGSQLASWLLAAAGLALLVPMAITPLDLASQATLAAAVCALSLALGRSRHRLATLVNVLISIAVSTRYLCWRLTSTFTAEWSVDAALGALLLLAELYAFLMLLLGYLPSVGPLQRRPVPLPPDSSLWPSVDVFIPTFSEPLAVVRSTVLAAKAMDWPSEKLRIYLLDDGRRSDFRAFAAEAGVGYFTRSDNHHAKAGNLNAALARSSGEFVAIFDCDHVPTRSFLQLSMGWLLRDPKLALVQTPHHFYSPDPFERNLSTFRSVPNEGALFYGLIQPGNDTFNASFFCGSCAVLRRSALEAVGGIAVETVTEDAHTALKMHRLGLRSAYLGVTLAAGLATESLSAHVGQRIRWARGMAQIFRIDNPLFGRGLDLWQRLSYAASMLHFFSGIPRLVFLLAPLAYLLFDLHIFNALPLVALSYAVPHLLHAKMTTSRIHGAFRHSFWSEVYETCLAPYTLGPTLLALFAPKAGGFNVTSKGGLIPEPFFDARIARPYLALLALNLAGAVAGIAKLGTHQADVVVMNLVWTAYNIVLLAGTLAVAWERRQTRVDPRVALPLPAMLRLSDGSTVHCRSLDLSKGGCKLSVPGGCALRPGQQAWVSLFAGNTDEVPFPATVVASEKKILRLKFSALSLEEESWLTQILFSRADAWSGWSRGHKPDNPLRGLGGIALHGARGLWQIARNWRPAPPPAQPAAEVAVRSAP